MRIISVPVAQCHHSRFNTRKVRSAEHIQRLAERIRRNGFETSRALWAVRNCDGYEVFAGGTRLEAVRLLGLETVPIVLYDGINEDVVSRLSDQDNENDEYHAPVSIVDVWAECVRLRDEEGWTQSRIGEVKGNVEPSVISRRQKAHTISDTCKQFVRDGLLHEQHVWTIQAVCVNECLAPWLTTSQAWEEVAAKTVADSGVYGTKTTRALQADVDVWREFIAYAEGVYESLPHVTTLYDLSGDWPVLRPGFPQADFVAALVERKARTLAAVKSAELAARSAIAENLAEYERFIAAESSAAARAAAQVMKEQRILARFRLGNCVELLASEQVGPIKLLLTDPPYGIAFQSPFRTVTRMADVIQGDQPEEAMGLLAAAIAAAMPQLGPEAHVLVFSSWQREPEVRAVLTAAGLRIKGSLVWVKEHHTIGDLSGSFAPRHERIVHAVRGTPRVTPRIPDVLEVTRTRDSTHPNEKPVELLRRLIRSTTNEGDTVVDLFAGQGSTLVAALRERREFWGAEIEPVHHEAGSSRLLREYLNGGNDE